MHRSNIGKRVISVTSLFEAIVFALRGFLTMTAHWYNFFKVFTREDSVSFIGRGKGKICLWLIGSKNW